MEGKTLIEEDGFFGTDWQQIIVGPGGDVVPEIGDKLDLLLAGELLDSGQVGKGHCVTIILAESENVAKKKPVAG